MRIRSIHGAARAAPAVTLLLLYAGCAPIIRGAPMENPDWARAPQFTEGSGTVVVRFDEPGWVTALDLTPSVPITGLIFPRPGATYREFDGTHTVEWMYTGPQSGQRVRGRRACNPNRQNCNVSRTRGVNDLMVPHMLVVATRDSIDVDALGHVVDEALAGLRSGRAGMLQMEVSEIIALIRPRIEDFMAGQPWSAYLWRDRY